MATAGNDTINGTAGNDLIDGLGGDDVITGGLGADTIRGGAGNDRFVIRGPGDVAAGESYSGGGGIDSLQVGADTDLSDVVIGADIENLYNLSLGASVLLTARQISGFDLITVKDITVTRAGTADLRGTDMNHSSITLGAAGVVLILPERATGLSVVGSAGRDRVTGSAEDDRIAGNDGDDLLDGGRGSDGFNGGLGADTVYGGDGYDYLTIGSDAEASGDRFYGGSGTDGLGVTAAGVTIDNKIILRDVERLSSNFAVAVDAAMLGRFSEIDTGTLTIATAGVCDLSGATVNTDTIRLGVGGITLKLTGDYNPHTIFGSDGDDIIFGGDHAPGNYLHGRGGNDTIHGGTGHDKISGGAGRDLLTGGLGEDTILIEAASHVVAGERYLGGAEMDSIQVTAAGVDLSVATIGRDIEFLFSDFGVGLGADQLARFTEIWTDTITINEAGCARPAGDVYAGTFILAVPGITLDLGLAGRNIARVVRGSSGADVVRGGDAVDQISGGGGADTLWGGPGGQDRLDGGAGDDTFYVDQGDSVVEAAGGGHDVIWTWVDAVLLTRNVEDLIYNGAPGADFAGTGNEGDNEIVSAAGADRLSGNDGADRLHGNLGNDRLTGGLGADRFIFETALDEGNVDTIIDFAADDFIVLGRNVFGAAGPQARLAGDAFVLGTQAADAEDRLVYDQASGKLFYDADGTGAGAQILFAELGAGTALGAADFQIFG
jgi:Ca2+-binding RTX toxin-like protein